MVVVAGLLIALAAITLVVRRTPSHGTTNATAVDVDALGDRGGCPAEWDTDADGGMSGYGPNLGRGRTLTGRLTSGVDTGSTFDGVEVIGARFRSGGVTILLYPKARLIGCTGQ